MKKIDKLVLGAFLGPFCITFMVVVFILLNISMLKYFDDIVGKDLGWGVVGQLFFYFAIFQIPTAMPLAVLLSSLIAFGNLGEHFELTAIKSAGVSLVRVLRPIMFFVLLLTVFAFLANNYLVPKAALEAYSLLYDIKQKKPALDLQEGAFYDGIPGISIKVNKKYADGKTFNDVVIYDHRKNDGNKEVIVADSGMMYTILNEQYLKLELFNGYNYTEGSGNERELTGQRGSGGKESLTRSKFNKTEAVFDLSSFKMGQTEKKWFQGNRIMRNLAELDGDMDSIRREIMKQRLSHYQYRRTLFNFYGTKDSLRLPPDVSAYQSKRDSIYINKYNAKPLLPSAKKPVNNPVVKEDNDTLKRDTVKAEAQAISPLKERDRPAKRLKASDQTKPGARDSKSKDKSKKTNAVRKTVGPVVAQVKPVKAKVWSDSAVSAKLDSLVAKAADRNNVQGAMNLARQVKSQTLNIGTQIDNYNVELRTYAIQWHYIIASSLACIVMFLIGAPLGAIIKRGGLGMPFLVSILFFIIYYVLTMQGQKLAKQGTFNVAACIYAADFVLFIAGLFFLRQARVDARLFESDSYAVMIDKLKKWRESRKKPVIKPAV